MKVGLIGLPASGKTTLFNTLTGGRAELHAFSQSGNGDANLGVVSVPDERQDWLVQLYRPRKTTYATVEIADVAGMAAGVAERGGFSPQFMAHLRAVDALVHIVRAFKDLSVPHPDGDVDATRDAELVELELVLADLAVVEKRLDKLDQEIQRKKGPEKTQAEAEKLLLSRFKEELTAGRPLRQIPLASDESKVVKGYTFLSQKPLLLVANIDESDIGKPEAVEKLAQFAREKAVPLVWFCAKSELEIARLDPEERGEFLQMLGIDSPARDKLVRAIYELLDVIPFFTVGDDEVRAWTITSGTSAQEAARKIHSDIARGFIRAEVVPFDALRRCGTWSAAKDQGLVRLEGKDYIVQNGDCINFRFAI